VLSVISELLLLVVRAAAGAWRAGLGWTGIC
jgi:hypothetical protein